MDEPAVASVEHYHIKTAFLSGCGGIAVGLCNAVHVLFGHGYHRVTTMVGVGAGPHGRVPHQLGQRQSAAVIQLNGSSSASGVDGICHIHQRDGCGGITEVDLGGLGLAGFQLYLSFSDGDQGRAAQRFQPIVGDHFIRIVPRSVKAGGGGWRGQEPVFQGQATHLQGAKQQIIGSHHSFLLCC